MATKGRIFTAIIAMGALLFFAPYGLQAQNEPPPTEAPTDGVSVTQEGNVTLDFRDADIRNVLRILSLKSGVNIVAGPDVEGVVTIQLRDVPWQRALDVILSTYGYGYDRVGEVIIVTTIENLKKRREDAALLSDQEPLVTKTYILNYAKAPVVIESVGKMKTARGSVDFDARTNAIIVRDIPANVELVGEVIKTLDTVTPQVLIETKIVETTLSNQENLGIDWVTQVSITGAQRPIVWPFVGRGTDSKFAPDDFPVADEDQFNFGTINFTQLQAILELLRTRTDTNILSNPRIVTLDNQLARIVVGSQYPIPSYVYNEEQARLQVNGFEYKDIGIIFEVTPHVNNKGFITLEIAPTVTDILDFVQVENTTLPRLSTEEARTTVMIKDGETLVIAGLVKDQVTDIRKKVPILGDIPLLGLLFQKKEQTVTKTDLLIFLTPHIITPDMDDN